MISDASARPFPLDFGISCWQKTEVGTNDNCVRTQAASRAAAHRGADAEGFRLVARRENDPGADDHRAAAQARVVALLDRGEERIEVGVEDGGVRHERMFADEQRA